MKKSPSLILSFVPILFLVVLLLLNLFAFPGEMLLGPAQIALLGAALVAIGIGIVYLKFTYKEIESAIVSQIKEVIPGILILLMIGVLSSTWMLSGVVPTMIYYGLFAIYSPLFFLLSTIICGIVALTTGSSWTTIATVGIALLGIGRSLGFDDGMIAGSIISGAYFGDKLSPLSDTTVLASSCTRTPLFVHIKNMLYTTMPSFVLALIIFTILGIYQSQGAVAKSTEIQLSIKENYNISGWLILLPLLTVLFIAKKMPAFLVLSLSSLLACVFAVLFQPHICQSIAGDGLHFAETSYKACLKSMFGTVSPQEGNPILERLTTTHGMGGMLTTVWLAISAMVFSGSIEGTGMLHRIVLELIQFMRGRISAVTTTVVTGLSMNIITADQYVSILLTGKMYSNVYDKLGLKSKLLSRSIEDSSTVTSVLVPWNTCGMTQAMVLGVSTIVYAPWCFFNLISPFMSIINAVIYHKKKRKTKSD